MGGYGSGRHGETATIESTASYEINITSLTPEFQAGRRLTGSIRFDEERLPETGFPVVITIDLTHQI